MREYKYRNADGTTSIERNGNRSEFPICCTQMNIGDRINFHPIEDLTVDKIRETIKAMGWESAKSFEEKKGNHKAEKGFYFFFHGSYIGLKRNW